MTVGEVPKGLLVTVYNRSGAMAGVSKRKNKRNKFFLILEVSPGPKSSLPIHWPPHIQFNSSHFFPSLSQQHDAMAISTLA